MLFLRSGAPSLHVGCPKPFWFLPLTAVGLHVLRPPTFLSEPETRSDFAQL